MRNLIFLILITISNFVYSQSEYRLFLGDLAHCYHIPHPLVKTDQLFNLYKTDDCTVFIGNAMSFEISQTTKVYFNNELVGEYDTKMTDSHFYYSLQFIGTKYEYFFFKLYSINKDY